MLIAAVLAAMAVTGRAQQVTSEQVAAGIRQASTYLQRQQRGGRWHDHGGHRGGVTALATLALLNAGLPPGHPVVAAGIEALDEVGNESVYVVSLKCQVYAAADGGRGVYLQRLRRDAGWLMQQQTDSGTWSYGPARNGRPDNSNTQLALLGLHEAAKAGVPVPGIVWQRSLRHYNNTQYRDGSWGYRRRTRGYGSMTAAGVASLYICGQRLHVGGRRVFIDGAYPDCGRYRQNQAIASGLDWLSRRFTVRSNPRGSDAWHFYYLYALERTGMIAGLRTFGEHDWYREGAAYLVGSQKPDGRWGDGVVDTAFGLLFLAKGNRPVLVQKLRWQGRENLAWNRNIHDLENLTAFIGDKLGKPTTWQATDLSMSVEELRVSPVLLITGHEWPSFGRADREKLKAYVEAGGLLLCEACCGSEAFAEGFRQFAAEVFAADGYPLKPVPAGHPLLRSYYQLGGPHGLEIIDVGCRTGVVFSPRALSCLWELQTIPGHSERAFKIGTNIAAYATGREQLPDRLDVVRLPDRTDPAEAMKEVPRGAVRLARLIHRGDYNADPHCLVNWAGLVRDRANVTVVARERHLKPTDDALYEHPVVFMHGHFSFAYDDEEIAALRNYLDRGGVLLADACCGRKAFDTSFRKMVARLYPQRKLTALGRDHPILTGQVGRPLGELAYRKVLADELGRRGTSHPPLEAVTVDGRTVILYSRYDFTCALEGDRPYSCRGYQDEDGRRLALNLLLYAITR